MTTGLIVSDARKARNEKQARLAVMLSQGLSARACATVLGVSKSTAGGWANLPEVAAMRHELEHNARCRAKSILADQAPAAAKRLSDLAQHENPTVSLKASVDLLRLSNKDTSSQLMPAVHAMEAFRQILEAVEATFGDDPGRMVEFYGRLSDLRRQGCELLQSAHANHDDETIDREQDE